MGWSFYRAECSIESCQTEHDCPAAPLVGNGVKDMESKARQMLIRMRGNLRGYNDKERLIAEYILQNPLRIRELSIHALAAELEVSVGTIVHFCKKHGFSGYRELKQVLEALPAEFGDAPLEPEGDPLTVLHSVWLNVEKVLADTLLVLDQPAFIRAVEAIEQAERIDFYARGGSARLAETAARKFVRWGGHVTFYRDSNQQKLSATQLNGKSVAIAISYSGYTQDVVECLAAAKKRGAFCIVITSCEQSPAARLADCVLLAAIRGPEMFDENEFSKIAQIAILDALYFCYIRSHLR